MSALLMPTMTEDATPAEKGRTIDSRVGLVEVFDANILTFPRGLLGFEGRSDYAVLNLPNEGMERFKLLQSLEDPALGFIVTEAAAAADEIDPNDLQDAYKQCEVRPGNALTLLVVSVRKEGDTVELSANLRAPIVIDIERRVGRQHVMSNGRYPIRFPL
ncbi:MAG: flagellar assembly protein FliW [Alphaproteobacteria bacterium]